MTMTMEKRKVDDVELDIKVTNIAYDKWYESAANEEEFRGVLNRVTEESKWKHDIQSNTMRIVPVEDNPLLSEQIGEDYKIHPALIWDTMENTKLLLQMDDEYYPVRTSAMKSLLETAKISGNALSKVSTTHLADILNYCLEVAKGNSLILVRAGKASAVLSSDARGYGILPMDQLFDATMDAITDKFGKGFFKEGSISHEYMKSIIQLPHNTRALEEYKDFVDSVYDLNDVYPGIVLKSSDVGMAAATLEPIFICRNKYWKVGNSVKLHHKPGNTMDDFKELAETMFSKLDKTIENFMEMSKITIRYPHTAFMLACKKAKLPKIYATEALEEFSMMVAANEFSNAHDIYLGISEILFYAQRDGMNNRNISFIEDNMAKILHFNWSELDLAGEHTW